MCLQAYTFSYQQIMQEILYTLEQNWFIPWHENLITNCECKSRITVHPFFFCFSFKCFIHEYTCVHFKDLAFPTRSNEYRVHYKKKKKKHAVLIDLHGKRRKKKLASKIAAYVSGVIVRVLVQNSFYVRETLKELQPRTGETISKDCPLFQERKYVYLSIVKTGLCPDYEAEPFLFVFLISPSTDPIWWWKRNECQWICFQKEQNSKANLVLK